MTVAELTKRVEALEKQVEELKAQVAANGKPTTQPTATGHQGRHWWRDEAGSFADDPGYEEMARLGREYREALRPGRREKTGSVKKPVRKQRHARS